MKLFPEMRRTAGLPELVSVWMGLSFGLPLMVGWFSGAGWPRFSDIVFGVAALVLLAAAIAVAAPMFFARVRPESALANAIPILLSAGAAALLLDLSGLWNDGSAYWVLKPTEAFSSMASLGFLPFRSGPTALLRFWPALVALGLVWRLHRTRIQPAKIALTAGFSYLLLAIAVHALSWVAWAIALGKSSGLSGVSDVFRLMVSAQSGGYWINGQGERFFAAIGRQAETGLSAAQASVWFLAACAVLLAWAAVQSRCLKLGKRLLTIESLPLLFVAAVGLGVGTLQGMADGSYTYWLSFAVACVAALAWVWRDRLLRDIENLPEDELARPHLPLPSGAVAPHEVGDLALSLGVVAFFGALLLGWPVFVGFVAAEFASWMRFRKGLAWGQALCSDALLQFLTALALGFSGLAYGSRGFSFMAWQSSAVVSAALLAAVLSSLRRSVDAPVSRPVRVALPTVAFVLALAVLRQPAVWGFGLLAATAQVAIGWRDEWHLRFRFLPGMLLLMTVAILALAWPVLWRTF
jgi:hypothetical protein